MIMRERVVGLGAAPGHAARDGGAEGITRYATSAREGRHISAAAPAGREEGGAARSQDGALGHRRRAR